METTKEQPRDAAPAAESKGPESRPRGRVIPLPGLPALPHLPALPPLASLPGIRQLSWLRPQVKLPSRDKVLLYTGLGAMAAVDLIDWPVAAAIAMATVLTSAGRRSQSMPEVSVQRDDTPPEPAPSAAPERPARRSRARETS